MAFSGDVVKYVFGGAMAGDTWSVGIHQVLTGLSSTPTPTQMNTASSDRLTGFNSLMWSLATNGLKVRNGTGVTLNSCKSYLYRGGVLTAQGTASITAVAGTGSSAAPFYTAMCVSLLTNTPGRSGRGRMYLPFTSGSYSSATGQLTTDPSALLTSMASWLGGYGPDDNDFPGDPTSHAVVLSNTTGAVHNITGIRADSLPDTQRGRMNKDIATSTWSATVT